jgi:hypothetical protein
MSEPKAITVYCPIEYPVISCPSCEWTFVLLNVLLRTDAIGLADDPIIMSAEKTKFCPHCGKAMSNERAQS